MRYALLLKPHPNVRYRQSLEKLALNETACMLNAIPEKHSEPKIEYIADNAFVVFESEKIPEVQWRELSRHSAVCFAAELLENGLMRPLQRNTAFSFPEDLPQVLKYKGKTNADFTAMMIHCAKAASDFYAADTPICVLDPMCGKGTTLFSALCEGYNAIGVETDRKALDETDQYFQRSMKMHRFKHKREQSSQTLSGGGQARQVRFTAAADAETMKNGGTQTLTLVNGDALRLPELVKAQSVHLIISDLPYGIQHAPKENGHMFTLEKLIRQVTPGCFHVLKNGGAMAFSFNVNTLSRQSVAEAMEQAGLKVLHEPPYDDFLHWVEQAVDRDVVICVKK